MRTLAVVGTAGGAGVSTLVALGFAGLRDHPAGAPRLLGPDGVGLLERAGGDEVAVLDDDAALLDGGVRAPREVSRLLASGDVVVVVAAPDTPLGRSDARRYLDALAPRGSSVAARGRVAVALCEVYGRHRGGGPGTGDAADDAVVLRVPFDRALARGGPVPVAPGALRPQTRPAVVAWQEHCARVLGR